MIVGFTESVNVVDDLLTLKGLRLVYERKRREARETQKGPFRPSLYLPVPRRPKNGRPGLFFLLWPEKPYSRPRVTRSSRRRSSISARRKRREVAERIKEAREFGDISENAEYDHAKNEQAMLEARIAQLEDKLRNATVIDQKQLNAGVVSVGTTVRVKDQKSGQSMLFHIVGSAEADPSESKLSNESPVGSALIGHKRGDIVTVQVPRGPNRKLKITKIEAA